VVLDVDGEEGKASLSQLGELPKTPCVRTSKGHHYYFRHPGGRIGNSVGLLPGLDIRGDGGYVIAPPSTHPTGTKYEWEASLQEMPLAPVPERLLGLTTKKERKPSTPTPSFAEAMSRSVKAAVDQIIGGLSQKTQGTRNDALNKAAFRLGQFIGHDQVDRGWAEAILTNVGIHIGLTAAETHATIESGMSAGIREKGDTHYPKYEILDDVQAIMDRPMRLIDGRAYGATWLSVVTHVDGTKQLTRELVIFDQDGQLYSERELPGMNPLDDLPFIVQLPEEPSNRGKLLSYDRLRRFAAGERPIPSEVFKRVVECIDAFVSFENSLADQNSMSEMIACWIMGTYAIDAFDVVGYLWPTGERGSGKT